MGKLIAERATARAAEAASDAAECVQLGRYADARDLIAETRMRLDDAEKRIGEAEKEA